MIKHVSLDHGWFYHYRLHNAKIDLLQNNGFSSLHKYLHTVFDKCPQEPFLTGPRSSQLKFDLGIRPRQIDNHEVSMLAKEGLHWNKYKDAHSNVQVFMLSYASKEPLSGHIDALRLEDDKLWIWDYKPHAIKEKYASTQTFFYALMLSKRTGIPLDNFMCGYFDDTTSFVFKPHEKYLHEKQMTLK
jgi:hypothetical protein